MRAGFRIAIQGELGSFSHEAALGFASGRGVEPEIVSCARSPEVFARLDSGDVDAAAIPIENALAGSVLEHYDLLRRHNVHIVAERRLRIRHNLIAAPGVELGQIREVYSHHIALDQCRNFFANHPALVPTSFYDTAGSVKHVVEQGVTHAGAIASVHAASQYGGAVLASGIEDNAENYTRFFLLLPGPAVAPAPGTALATKVSLCFVVENRPGSLVDALGVFAARETNLTKLESRPVPGEPWQYVFYADFELGPGVNPDAALQELAAHCRFVKELGRYSGA